MTDPRTPTSDPVAEPHAIVMDAIEVSLQNSGYTASARLSRAAHAAASAVLAVLPDQEAIRQQARAAFAAQVAAGAISVHVNDGSSHDRAMAWSEGYSEGFAAASPEPASPGSGLAEAFLDGVRIPDSNPVAQTPYGRGFNAAAQIIRDRLAARPDGAEADAS